ncbi:hypothetical protein S83_015199, partial [Arachis hypogaea]
YTTATRSGILPPSVALKVRHPSSSFPRAPSLQPLFAVTDRGCFLELGIRRLCLLSRASVAVCLPFTAASSSAFARRSPFAFTRCSPFEFAFIWKPRCSASNSATNPRLHSAVELLSVVPAVSFLNPPPDNTLTQHQYSSSNSATSDFYYN